MGSTAYGFLISVFCLSRPCPEDGGEAFAMADHEKVPPLGEDALEAVNDAMVALHERYHGRRPASSRTIMMATTCSLVCSVTSTPTWRRR